MEINDELKKARLLNLSEKFSEVMFQRTQNCFEYSQKKMIPLLKQIINPTNKEKAIIGIFFRIQAWMATLNSMNKTVHFQGVASAARSLFELLLDILIIKKDSTGIEAEKYLFFPEIEKFKVAKRIVEFVDNNASSQINVDIYRKYINDKQKTKNIYQNLRNLWSIKQSKGIKSFPNHWSGKNLRQRARDIGPEYEEIYLDTYPKLSWSVHAGATVYLNLEDRHFVEFFGICHDMIQKRFIKAMIETAKSLGIDKGINDFYSKMKIFSNVPSL